MILPHGGKRENSHDKDPNLELGAGEKISRGGIIIYAPSSLLAFFFFPPLLAEASPVFF